MNEIKEDLKQPEACKSSEIRAKNPKKSAVV